MSGFVLDTAIEVLQKDGVVAIPTETVYGLAARISSPVGIKKIFTTKQRPFFDPLIVHVSSKKMAETLTTDWSPLVDFLAEHFWPGPLTFVLPKSTAVDAMITSGLETVGIRMPKHSLALSLIDRLNEPLAAPSANRFGKTSPTSAEHVRSEFPNDHLVILDGGPCDVGLESTVLHISHVENSYRLSILRKGAVTKSDLERALSYQKFQVEFVEALSKKESPGHMKHHYMPEIPLAIVIGPQLSEKEILEKAQEKMKDIPDEVEGVRIVKPQQFRQVRELVLPSDAAQSARLLYSELRNLSTQKTTDLLYFRLQPAHSQEAWQAVMDRLTKAASLILN